MSRLLALGAPTIEIGDMDVDLAVGSVVLRDNGSVAVLLETGDGDTVLVSWAAAAVDADVLRLLDEQDAAA